MYKLTGITPRVMRLRDLYRDTVPALDAERTRILTDYYKSSENEVPILRRAKFLYKLLTEMTIHVDDDELIVGNIGKGFRPGCLWAEYTGLNWLGDELRSGEFDKRDSRTAVMTLSQEDRDYLLSVEEYWERNGVGAKLGAAMPQELSALAAANVIPHIPGSKYAMTHSHFTVNYRKAVTKGFGAIRDEAREKLAEMHGNVPGDKVEQYFFYQAIEIVCDAVIALSKRYAAECRKAADRAESEGRRAELLQMADSLDWIMENPARTLHEALQVIFLYYMSLFINGDFLGLCPGRVDQDVGDFLDADLASGRITQEDAQELFDCFAIKLADMMLSGAAGATLVWGAYSNNIRITIGGLKPDGTDATNAATYMLLQTAGRLQLHDPTLSLCIHEGTPDELWEAGLETVKITGGIPTFDSCNLIVDLLVKRGLSLEDARNFCIIGCDEVSGTGCDFSNVSGPFSKTFITMPGAMVLAVNDGVNPQNGVQSGLHTGYLYEMESFEQLRDAFEKQFLYFLDWKFTLNNICEYVGNQYVQSPIASATMDGCMESGKDMIMGGAKYNGTGGACLGMGTVTDSLAAIKYLVFDKKICTARELYDAIMADWEGYEPLRQRVINEAPHYGNGDPYADEIIGWVSDLYADRFNSYMGMRGKHNAGIYSAGVHVAQGLGVWATPDGRKNRQPISDGISAAQGADKNGPTGVASSVIAAHPYNYANGMQFCLKFHPSSMAGEDGNIKMRSFIETFFDQGGMQIQYNVISSDIMREAQANPEDYKNLVVRVAGFSAYFVELNELLQNDLISRTDNVL